MNLLVAFRLLFSKYNLSFISIISKVSIIGLMLGVFPYYGTVCYEWIRERVEEQNPIFYITYKYIS